MSCFSTAPVCEAAPILNNLAAFKVGLVSQQLPRVNPSDPTSPIFSPYCDPCNEYIPRSSPKVVCIVAQGFCDPCCCKHTEETTTEPTVVTTP